VEAPRILHIATHGFFLETTPLDAPGNRPALENPLLRSGLALAGANLNVSTTEDGVFTALEASSLNLWGTQLVTLSACDTGVGEVRNGDGVYGLRRAFFLAGAQTLVMSMWPVSDYVTRQIMTSYYTGLSQGLGRGEALRRTQLAVMRHAGRRHPFYWASFIQAGDWRSLQPASGGK
jgi:CHAT domain-containing protein